MIAIYLSSIEDEEQRNKFEQLYYKYRNLMYYIASGILKNETDAEDAVQEAFFRIARNMDKVGELDDSATKNFVAIIAKREALRIVEKSSRYGIDDEMELEKIVDKNSQFTTNSVVEAIKAMPQEFSTLMSLKYVFGYSGKEIAEITGLTEVNVRQKLFKGKKILEKMIG